MQETIKNDAEDQNQKAVDQKHDHGSGSESDHDHDAVDTEEEKADGFKKYLPAIISFVLLIGGIIADNQVTKFQRLEFFQGYVRLAYYLIPYLLIGWPVLKKAYRSILRRDFFNEFMLMSIATLGAFYIKEYPEGVAVMLFYQIGELFQDAAVQRAKRSIKALLDIRPDEVNVLRNGKAEKVHPTKVAIGETIQIKSGEKIALDGELLSEKASFNTAALTGESKPDNKYKGEPVLAGMINLDTVSEVKVTALFKDSKLSKILELVQDATAKKAKTQLFISRFARRYTPVMVFLAIAITVVPSFFVDNYVFNDWLYRALVFLVISCPCALVVSIPLGYFGGIGLASRNGILFKGSNYLDVMTGIDTVVMDKTGTLTKGVFKVQQVEPSNIEKDSLLKYTAALETHSTHPIAKAVVAYVALKDLPNAENVEEIAGYGLKGTVEGKQILVGNLKLLSKFNIAFDEQIKNITDTIVVTAIDGKYAGYLTIADEIKEDALEAIKALHGLGIKTVMLSGDKQAVVDAVAKTLGIDAAYGDLLPEGKVEKVQALKNEGKKIAFVGDGVNDAPVVALADAGIAMGGLGSDATIETADIVIQNDQPYKIFSAIKIGKLTKRIVWQNISLAFAVKVIVLILGAGGLATLWEAVFADVGVALLAILNAVRIQKIKL
ncbi:heavy metal translocating P-type ATPase [Cytophaga hutchinsonii]|uniref:P-type Zn(2+) transporter n=1 Tax=Cytophaga hutchinsonii (strain ATCC 33406 / DSM 1761 / CIP 103989 / NBRC 15051 / NCIMB 9469 / D465) TaxID=269798 RepID=A0A6N4SR06_CYTH3|nr:heavy metal translocating P-type ATPase [Cytophaga hutchinsonii]ABG58781.1 cation-transporting ATPase; possible zinc-transporting ATPase [Cytophaga hutchinsonii ATCC 33406]SFX61655.1 Cd2+/Zn2+-exporting ATPase [Cytophaga hutchinsonii ATCC 33406]